MMHALTVRQPYATLLVVGLKRQETRTRALRTFGTTAIHAGLAMPCRRGQRVQVGPYEVERDACGLLLRGPGIAWPYRLPLGALVGTVDFFQCRPTTSLEHAPGDVERALGDHSPGRFAWSTSSPHRLYSPIPARGALGLWTVPDELEAAIREQVTL